MFTLKLAEKGKCWSDARNAKTCEKVEKTCRSMKFLRDLGRCRRQAVGATKKSVAKEIRTGYWSGYIQDITCKTKKTYTTPPPVLQLLEDLLIASRWTLIFHFITLLYI